MVGRILDPGRIRYWRYYFINLTAQINIFILIGHIYLKPITSNIELLIKLTQNGAL